MHTFRVKVAAAVTALAALSCPKDVAAAEPPATFSAPDTTQTYLYASPAKKYYLRAALELSGVLVAGAIQYATEQGNSTDWDLNYDWPSFRKKLTGEAIRFDTNRFDTNMITHPAGGMAYYLAARGNRLSVLESFLYATGASTMWEFVGEFREKASINDLVVTPVAGAVFGEAFTQLGVLFERSRRTPVTRALAALFAPAKAVHDTIDGASPWRSRDTDGLFTSDEAHRFEVSLGAVATRQDKGPTWGGGRFELHTEIVNVPDYERPGHVTHVLDDANVSRIDGEAELGRAGLADLQLDVMVAPLAYYLHALEREPDGALRGQRLVLGMTAGFDYGVHLYDRTTPSEMDQVSGVHLCGAWVEHDAYLPPFHVRTTLGLRPELSAVRALAVDEYFRRHDPDRGRLPTVVRDESYYFASGATLTPAVEVSAHGVSLGAMARFDTFFSIEGLDRFQEQVTRELPIHDRRALGRAWIGWTPASWLVLRAGVDRRTRTGEIGDAVANRSEDALWTSAGTVF